MSQILTNALATYKAQQEAAEQPVILDQIVFAYVPGIDPEAPIDPDSTLPPEEQIVYRYDIPSQNKGFINPDAVVYSCLLGTDIGTWTYNSIYLINSELNLAGSIITTPDQVKVAADPTSGIEGDTLVRNIVTTYANAQELTQITVAAEVWQLDFTLRLAAMDERVRQINLDEYGHASFFEDGWKVTHTAGATSATINPGVGYVGGLKSVLASMQTLDLTGITLPKTVYVVSTFQGQANSAWETTSEIRVETSLDETFTENGYTYYSAPLALLSSSADAKDLRQMNKETEFVKKDDISQKTDGEDKEKVASEYALSIVAEIAREAMPQSDAYKIQPKNVGAIDLDILGSNGWYEVEGSSGGSTNTPSANKLLIKVWRLENWIYQEAVSYFNPTEQFHRCFRTTTPNTPWVRSYNTSFKPTPSDINAIPQSDAYRIQPKSMGAIDYDTLQDTGWFIVAGGSGGSTNAPAGDDSLVKVWIHGGFVHQQAFSYFNKALLAIRCFALDGKNEPWARYYNTSFKPSADDVGARPDDWMPSADDVGARADDWMPSANDVGAVPQSDAYKIQPKDVGAIDLDTLASTGWYQVQGASGGSTNTPSGNVLLVKVWRLSNWVFQEGTSYFNETEQFFRCFSTSQKNTPWERRYTTAFKPNATDVGALQWKKVASGSHPIPWTNSTRETYKDTINTGYTTGLVGREHYSGRFKVKIISNGSISSSKPSETWWSFRGEPREVTPWNGAAYVLIDVYASGANLPSGSGETEWELWELQVL